MNESVSRAARERGIWCNVVDRPGLCDFITPALVVRGELQISVSTGGGSPTLAQRVKREIAALIGDEYGELLEIASGMRTEAKESVKDSERRTELLRAFVESEAIDLLREGRSEDARRLAHQLLKGEYANGRIGLTETEYQKLAVDFEDAQPGGDTSMGSRAVRTSTCDDFQFRRGRHSGDRSSPAYRAVDPDHLS